MNLLDFGHGSYWVKLAHLAAGRATVLTESYRSTEQPSGQRQASLPRNYLLPLGAAAARQHLSPGRAHRAAALTTAFGFLVLRCCCCRYRMPPQLSGCAPTELAQRLPATSVDRARADAQALAVILSYILGVRPVDCSPR